MEVPAAISVDHVNEVPLCWPRFSRAAAPGWFPGRMDCKRRGEPAANVHTQGGDGPRNRELIEGESMRVLCWIACSYLRVPPDHEMRVGSHSTTLVLLTDENLLSFHFR